MLTTVAVLIIVLGLMVSLARDVRRRSAEQLTRSLLQRLEAALEQYFKNNSGQLPPVEPLFADRAVPDLAGLEDAGRRNNRQLVAILKMDARLRARDVGSGVDPFQDLPISVYDHYSIRDAWGSPIVFMPGQHPLIGMAPSKMGQDQAFFFSAGPDRNYLTRDDNLYSYELPASAGQQ
ncbi:hypothetical protein [Fontivita pretiosa]|uniref:hypothetical protein n=1 Tax=Fontivita pretiosa TaxID=2989684 RepID=UPI003D17277E